MSGMSDSGGRRRIHCGSGGCEWSGEHRFRDKITIAALQEWELHCETVHTPDYWIESGEGDPYD